MTEQFSGFEEPTANFTRIPNAFLEAMSVIDTIGEMKVVYYILRHTWGFQDDCKRITLDEFQHGRKRRDGTRLDSGTGLAKGTIIDGLRRAEQHGFIEVETDESDAARIRKHYSLRMKIDLGVQLLDSGVQGLDSRSPKIEHRTEKDTPERHSKKLAASPRQAQLQEDDCSIEIYYRDKTKVKSVGTVSRGPWEVTCPSCGNDVRVEELDVPVGCLCGMHEFTLLSKKPHIPVRQKKPEAVDAYYAIVKSRGVRYGANEEFETDIAAAVTDLTRWRQVVKEYIHPDVGGNPYAVDKMLVYYREERLPGSRRAREQDTAPKFTLLEADT